MGVALVALVALVGLGAPTGWAAIGDPCDADEGCAPGELCLSAADDGYCSARCPAAGCPDGFRCDPAMVCVRGDATPRAALGEDCATLACVDGLVCLDYAGGEVCSRACGGPGACPDGLRCFGQTAGACVPLQGLPGDGEPCAAGRACDAELACVDDPARQRPNCTHACAEDSECDGRLRCVDGLCRHPTVDRPGFGDACNPISDEPAVAGCRDDAPCFVRGLTSYCTQACDGLNPCPAGYGCRFTPADAVECRRGVADDPGLSPPEIFDVAVLPPPPVDAGPPVSLGGGEGGDGCVARPGVAPKPLILLLFLCVLALIGVRAPRRP